MADKKKQEALKKKINQVLVVCACVFFVILMILSGMSSHWLSIFTVVKPGDRVIVDYTFYDANGNPVLTDDLQSYTRLAQGGKNIIFGKNLSVIAGQNTPKLVSPVPIYIPGSGWTEQFAVFGSEYNAISAAAVGMRSGDHKRISIANGSIVQQWQRENVGNALNWDALNTGDALTMAVSDMPEENITANSTTYVRIGVIAAKTNETLLVDSGYPAADISISAINPGS